MVSLVAEFDRNLTVISAEMRSRRHNWEHVSQPPGQHNGLPASIIVTTTLTELEAAAGQGITGGGTILPMSDVIRLGRHARHYLAIFDKGKALALYHTKRLASPRTAHRLVCEGPGLFSSGLRRQGLLQRSPPHRSLHPMPRHGHRPAHLRLRGAPSPRRKRLAHSQKRPRRNRMDSAAAPGPRATTNL